MDIWNSPNGPVSVFVLPLRRTNEYGEWEAKVRTQNRTVMWVKERELASNQQREPLKKSPFEGEGYCPSCGASEYTPGVECGCGYKEGFREWLLRQ